MTTTAAITYIERTMPALTVTANASDRILGIAADALVATAAGEGVKVTQPDALAAFAMLRAMAR